MLIKIAYDGTNFHGWQKQEGLRTVQGEIEKAIWDAFKMQAEVFASGRTDAGVHAFGQMAHFDVEESCPTRKIKTVLNRILPPDIQILSAKKVASDFHARFDAKAKTYLYKICKGEKNCFWQIGLHLSKNWMKKNLKRLHQYLLENIILKGFAAARQVRQIL